MTGLGIQYCHFDNFVLLTSSRLDTKNERVYCG